MEFDSMGGGALVGVVGELTGEFASNAGLKNNQAIAVAGAAGALSAIGVGNLIGDDDNKIAKNIYLGQSLGSNATQNNFIQGKMMDDNVQQMWLEDKITDSEYQKYQQARNQGDKIAGEIAFTGITLGASSAVINSANLGEGLLLAKVGSAVIGGSFGSIGAVATSFIGGEKDLVDLSKIAGIGFGVGMGSSLLPVNGVLGMATSAGVAGFIESTSITFANSPNASIFNFASDGAKGFATGFTSGLVVAPILIYGGNSLPVHFVAGQTVLGTGVATSATIQMLFPQSTQSGQAVVGNNQNNNN